MHYQNELKKILSRAKAPITGRGVSCIIEGNKSKYFLGWNIEEKKLIEHAEINALRKVPQKVRIKGIHLMPSGTVLMLKNAIPCENCINTLSRFILPKARIFLWPEKGSNKNYSASFVRVKAAYAKKKKKSCISPAILLSYLKTSTPLLLEHRNFLVTFCALVREHNSRFTSQQVEVYITGSASGRGGPKTIFTKQITGKNYTDIDLILIFPKRYVHNVNFFVRNHYRLALMESESKKVKIVSKTKVSYKLDELERKSKNFLFRKEYYSTISGSIPIDISVGRTIEAVVTKTYLRKNWIIRIV